MDEPTPTSPERRREHEADAGSPAAPASAPAPPTRVPGGRTPRRLPLGSRVLAGGFALGCFGVLAVASTLSPAAEGHGTHTDLGLPACGFASTFGTPCMTCGMTTSFSHMTNGDPVASFLTQPMGAVLTVFAATAFWIAGYVACTGSPLGSVAMRMLTAPKTLWAAGLLLGGSWLFKIITWNG
jgi:hypothetical protein